MASRSAFSKSLLTLLCLTAAGAVFAQPAVVSKTFTKEAFLKLSPETFTQSAFLYKSSFFGAKNTLFFPAEAAPLRYLERYMEQALRASQPQRISEWLDEAADLARQRQLLRVQEGQFAQLRSAEERYFLTPADPGTALLYRFLEKGVSHNWPLKQQIRTRLKTLLDKRVEALNAYGELAGASLDSGKRVKVHYSGSIKELRKGRFSPQDLTLALEVHIAAENRLLAQTPFSAVLNEADAGTRGTLQLTRGNNRMNVSVFTAHGYGQWDKLYQKLLGCSVSAPCYLETKGDTALVYANDRKHWLRIGVHELENTDRLHLHLQTYITLHLKKGPEQLMLNYVLPVSKTPALWRAEKEIFPTPQNGYAEINSANFPDRYRRFVVDPLNRLARQGILRPF